MPVLLHVYSTVLFRMAHVGFHVGRQLSEPAMQEEGGGTGGGTGGLGPHCVAAVTTAHAAGLRHTTL
jgi:hypothetical protein